MIFVEVFIMDTSIDTSLDVNYVSINDNKNQSCCDKTQSCCDKTQSCCEKNCEKNCDKIDNFFGFRKKLYFVIIHRIIFFSFFVFQIWKFVNYLIFLNYIKNRENVFYSFNSVCACTNFATINGTTNDMYDSMRTRGGPIIVYPYIITIKILGVLFVIIYDWQIYRRLVSTKLDLVGCKKDYKFGHDEFTIFTKSAIILCSVIGLAMALSAQSTMTFSTNGGECSVWFYECLPNYVPVQTNYNMCNSSCAYQVDHYSYEYPARHWNSIDVFCVNVTDINITQQNNPTMSAYDTYFDILYLKSLINELTIVIKATSIHELISNGLSQVVSLIYSCFAA